MQLESLNSLDALGRSRAAKLRAWKADLNKNIAIRDDLIRTLSEAQNVCRSEGEKLSREIEAKAPVKVIPIKTEPLKKPVAVPSVVLPSQVRSFIPQSFAPQAAPQIINIPSSPAQIQPVQVQPQQDTMKVILPLIGLGVAGILAVTMITRKGK